MQQSSLAILETPTIIITAANVRSAHTMNTPPINFRTLDLNLLKVFDIVMVERNVTRAAARLSMTSRR